MTRLAAVTGGTGFLGRAVVAALVRRGWRVRLLARRDPAHPQLPAQGVEVVRGDLDDPESLRVLVRGAAAVVHGAGLIKAPSRSRFFAVNGDGAGRLAAAVAAAAPAARLVAVSSLAAREPQLSDYAASKRAGEEALRAAAAAVAWTIVRPPAIYGPWDRETLAVFRAARGPLLPLFHGPESRVCLIHVDDATAAVAALCDGGPTGRIFELSDARREGYPWTTVLRAAAAASGGTPRLVRVPPAVVRLGGAVAGALGRLGGGSPMLTAGKAREILHPDWSSAAERQPPTELWTPAIALDDGFAATVRWYRDAGWL
ncbi:NAD-dependent epimerase/dehydratase family protein [Azospirillum sp. ST 5-10]|uniref:NAD-dependent epimerase/dehydratase family protein n=1 Tax=unclassified Azospirillum TaxID=2630922 RepID=UPI003F4A1EB6